MCVLVLVPHSTLALAPAPGFCCSCWFWCPYTMVWVTTREQWFGCPHENSGLASIHSGLGVDTRTVVWVSAREQWFGCPYTLVWVTIHSGLGVHTRTLVLMSTRSGFAVNTKTLVWVSARSGFAMNRKRSFGCPHSGFAVNTKTKSWTLDVCQTLVTT